MNGNRGIECGEIKPKDEVVKGRDLRIEELNNDIATVINKANLPAKALEYILANYLN